MYQILSIIYMSSNKLINTIPSISYKARAIAINFIKSSPSKPRILSIQIRLCIRIESHICFYIIKVRIFFISIITLLLLPPAPKILVIKTITSIIEQIAAVIANLSADNKVDLIGLRVEMIKLSFLRTLYNLALTK